MTADMVRLASGGPAMTVAEIGDDDRAGCCWFAHGDEARILRHYYTEHRFPVAALVRVPWATCPDRIVDDADRLEALERVAGTARASRAVSREFADALEALDALGVD